LGISSYLPSDSKSRAAETIAGAPVAVEVAPIQKILEKQKLGHPIEHA
jgi:hypothetical protein